MSSAPPQPPTSPPLEATLLVKREAQVFPLPPRSSAQGYKAASWDTSKAWTGRLRILHVTYSSPAHATGHLGAALAKQVFAKPPTGQPEKPYSLCVLKLEDATSGDLFGESLIRDVEADVERVLDSSRYFVIKLVDRASGRSAFAGFGFADRADAFDFNVALQDFGKAVRYELGLAPVGGTGAAGAGVGQAQAQAAQVPPMDFGLKDGQQIKLNIGGLAKKIGNTQAQPVPTTAPTLTTSTGNLFFPPPPAPAPGLAPAPATGPSDDPFAFADFASSSPGKRASGNEWAEFASAPATGGAQAPPTQTVHDDDPFPAFK
ncbi:hypothetical protein BCR44DRAFT_33726 [Catenaria anguillulae PL171]|uniref:NECAP PHear domain-containing protein n=1 Tax=Catenaria anguillulae PL171 TaxID=765915 RepID=A0A1Y2HCZ2_9FUNG|nr:hypothetical protein BCR44DRAFT_33726 [Catenaria anguillulae PL171]